MAAGATARVIERFHGWEYLKNMSPYIAVVQCGNPTPPKPNVMVVGGTKSDSTIQTVFTLKGTNDVSPTRLLTDRELCSGKHYLVFGYCNGDVYCAYEDYKVVPLEKYFGSTLIAGKPLDEQISILLQIRLANLKREMQKNEEEKRRLEEGLKQ